MLAAALVAMGCSHAPEDATPAPAASDQLRLEVGRSAAGSIYGVAAPPRAETDQVPVYELYAGRDALGIRAIDAVVDADTNTLVWIGPDHALWAAPAGSAPAHRQLLDRRAVLGLATARGRLAFAVRSDGPETAAFVVDLRTLERTALADGPGPDEVLGFSPDGTAVLVLSGRTGLASLFALGIASTSARQLTNLGLRPGPGLDTARVAPTPSDRHAIAWGARGIAYRAAHSVVLVQPGRDPVLLAADTAVHEVVR